MSGMNPGPISEATAKKDARVDASNSKDRHEGLRQNAIAM
jgi:hypothetical protein